MVSVSPFFPSFITGAAHSVLFVLDVFSTLSPAHVNRNRYVRASVKRSSHNRNREATPNVLSVNTRPGILRAH